MHLDVETVIEDGRVLSRDLTRELIAAGQHRPRQFATETAGQRDNPFVQLAQQLLVHARLVIKTFSEAGGHQAAQVAVALQVHGQQDEVEIPAALVVIRPDGATVLAALGRHVHLAADDRLNPLLSRGAVKLDGAEHVAVVSDRHRRHAVRLHLRHQVFNLVGAVQQTVLRMKMKMHEPHRLFPLPSYPISL